MYPMTFTRQLSGYLSLELEISEFVFLMVFITLQSYSFGGNEYDKTGHSKIFPLLRHFILILKRNIFRASILHHSTDTGNTQCHASQI